MTAITLDQSFVRTVKVIQGPSALDWLDRIDSLGPDVEKRFNVRVAGTTPHLSRNLVLWAETPNGVPVVVKCAPPSGELRAEATALRLYDGESACRLLDHWPESEALMIERVLPGTPLDRLTDDRQAMAAAASVMPGLWRPVPKGVNGPRLSDLAKSFADVRAAYPGGSCPIEPELIERAEVTFAALNRTNTEPRIIHGDLHFNAILSGTRRSWLAIDPRGMIGDPAFDVGMVVADPSHRITRAAQPMRVLAQRLTFLPDLLGLSRERVAGYAFAQTVLIACAMLRDAGRGYEVARGMARAISRLIFKDSPARSES